MDDPLTAILATARAAGREVLLETEALEVARLLGLGVPVHRTVADAREAAAADLGVFPGDRLVVKVLSSEILHKSDVGGVAVVAKKPQAVAAAVAAMADRLAGRRVAGFSLVEHVAHDASLGGELLVGVRHTGEFGPVVTFGPGGIHAELLSASLAAGRDVAVLSPAVHGSEAERIAEALGSAAITPAVTVGLRGQPPRIATGRLVEILERFLALAEAAVPEGIAEFEINPLVFRAGEPVALDALLRLGGGEEAEGPAAVARPVEKIERLLRPRSIAVIGVSETRNPGRVILENVLRAGFDRRRVLVVKPGAGSIAGCRCVADVASLPGRMDLVVLAIGAAQVPAAVAEIVAHRKAESLILIPGGLGERRGSEGHVDRVRSSLAAARKTSWRGPVVNGGNCLGVRSLPGRYDTLFIPRHKLRFAGPPTPLAVVSQSGAFAVARASKLPTLNPRYVVTVGNQIDLTVGDWLAHLADDPEIEVFACYLEGFRPGDGRRFLAAVGRIAASGRPVVLYRAGRTPAGAGATASHTASIAGDYKVTRALARAAGAVVAETLADFEDLVRLFCLLRGKEVRGRRLGAMSNAGFECVAIADHLGRFELPAFGDETRRRLASLLERSRLGSIVEVRNPLDVTPILGDEAYVEAVRGVLGDQRVDVGVVGCVPLTGALSTLAAGADHGEDVGRPGSVARRLAGLRDELPKAWVAVVDGGPLYDPMARLLEERGVVTFRTADRALRLFGRYCDWRLSSRPPPSPGRNTRRRRRRPSR